MKPPRQAAIWFILISVLLDVLSFGLLIPVLPGLIKEFTARGDWLALKLPTFLGAFLTGSDESLAALCVGLFGFVWALMHFFWAPILGVLSDKYGRRRVLLISCFGLGIDYIVMGCSQNLTWLFIGRIISGITASGFATAAAYIADVTPPEKRAAAFGMFGAAFGIGFVIGPGLGGVLHEFMPRLPFWVAAALTLLNACYGFFILPESLAVEHRKPFSWARANPIGSLRLLLSQSGLLGLAMVYFLYQLAHQVLNNVFVLYTENRYHWTPWMVGMALAIVGCFNIIVQGGLVRPALKRLGEQALLFVGLGCGVIGYSLYGLADEQWKFWAATPVFSLMAFFTPAIQGLMSRRLGPSVQGELQGANGSLMGIAGMIGPLLFPSIYAYSVNPNTTPRVPAGLPFLVAASCLAIGIIIAAWTLTRSKATPTRQIDLHCWFLALAFLVFAQVGYGQQTRRKPTRAVPPVLNLREFDGIFFDDVQKQLVGVPPSKGELANPSNASGAAGTQASNSGDGSSPSGSNLWKDRISGESIEGLVKEGKQRLDGFISTPSKFTGGSHKDARREFTLLAILFATIEQYPEKIRWQNSAAIARIRFARMAANAKVATAPAYNEAKLRMEDLATLLKGTPLADSSPASELIWSEIADRGPSMQLLEWAFRENLNTFVASEKEFKSHTDEIMMYAELIGLIGETLRQPGMVDVDDDEYKSWANKMIQEATRISEAVKLSNPSLAREAAGQLDQACNACHNTFR